MIIMNASDWVFNEDGTARPKRKYGKFKRPAYNFNPNDTESFFSAIEADCIKLAKEFGVNPDEKVESVTFYPRT